MDLPKLNRITALAAICVFWAAAPIVAQESTADWLQLAEDACEELQDIALADRIEARLSSLYVQLGDVQKAKALKAKLNHPQLRLLAQIEIAGHYARLGWQESCISELEQAREFALLNDGKQKLIDALLDFAKSPELALEYFDREPADVRPQTYLCEALAKRGHIDEALQIVEREEDDRQKSTLIFRIAKSAAEAGRIADTERIIPMVAMQQATDYYKNSIWMALAFGLYEQEEFEAAKKYAALVTHKTILRRNRQKLAKIAEGKNWTRNASTAPPFNPRRSNWPGLQVAIREGNAEKADEHVEEMLKLINANPIKSTSGQFGPSNQTMRVAEAEMQFALVAKLYRDAGREELADLKLDIAVGAMQTLVGENPFYAMLNLVTLLGDMIKTKDWTGIKRTTDNVQSFVWFSSADKIVESLIDAEEVELAHSVAQKALASKAAMGNKNIEFGGEILDRFIRLRDTRRVVSLVAATYLDEFGEAIIEDAGRELAKAGFTELLLTRAWRQLPPGHRTFLYIGVAQELRRQDSDPGFRKP